MIVSAASRMFSAISFGVFCRLAPSTRAIIRSMKLSPGFWVIRTTIRSESTLVPPVTARPVAAGLADDRGGLAGDRRLVDAGDALDDVAVAGDDLRRPRRPRCRPGAARRPATVSSRYAPGRAGRPAGQPAGDGVLLGLAQRRGLGLAAALGDRLGEVGEDHGQPQPDGDQPGEHDRVGDRQHGGEDRADLDDEHHRVAPQRARVELAQRVRQRPSTSCFGSSRPPPTRRGAGLASARRRAAFRAWRWSSREAFRERAEREGGQEGQRDQDHGDADDHADEQRPVGRQRAGRRRAPAVCRASEPARPSTKTIGRNRPSSMPARARCPTRRC